jgi:uncharacterized protein
VIEYELDDLVDPMAADEEQELEPVEIPVASLSPEALDGVIQAFVLREGTDYGERETPHTTKLAQVRRQLERGDIVIVFDPRVGSVTLVPRAEWKPPRADNRA